jgi:hypothetical protein
VTRGENRVTRHSSEPSRSRPRALSNSSG